MTVNIDLSDVTNKYYTVLYRTVVVYEEKNRSLVFSGSRKIPTLGSTVQWETRQEPNSTVEKYVVVIVEIEKIQKVKVNREDASFVDIKVIS